MPLKKALSGKSARLPRRSDYTKDFQKDWRGLQHSGINLASLKEAMTLLIANEGPLAPEWRDHALHGKFTEHRECHAGGDLLLVYKLPDDESILFVRAGTHSTLFESS